MTDKPVATIAQSVPELEDLKENLLRHGLPLGIGISLAVCIAVGVLFVRGRTSSAEADAQRILSSARAMPDLEQVVNNYPKTAAAPLALLKLARANYDTGNYQLALQQYDTFAATYAEHPFLAASELGRAHCLEAQGRIQDALTQYTSFATT
ncbi:MAG: tetratricopeptide repeat protein, partial [Verrucomicrobia bacterium]|nr:tetratricopeptide repeat protein [Verrucomicrobiota bacterium]